jgi:hypothetical protein
VMEKRAKEGAVLTQSNDPRWLTARTKIKKYGGTSYLRPGTANYERDAADLARLYETALLAGRQTS